MMKRIIKNLVIVLTVVAGFGLFSPQHASAAKAGYMAKSSVKTGTYLQTRTTIHTTNGYFKDVKVTIPKGTIFNIGSLYENPKTRKTSMTIDLNQLRWSIRKPVIDSVHNQQSTAGIWAKTSWFKKVSEPTYLKYYSSGDGYLWQGNKWPENPVKATADGVRVTSDGYLETFNEAQILLIKAVKPLSTAKVQHVLQKGKTTYFYTQTKLAGVTSQHVRTSGKYQYRLAINRNGRHLLTPTQAESNSKSTDAVYVSNRYYVGGATYYMHATTVFT